MVDEVRSSKQIVLDRALGELRVAARVYSATVFGANAQAILDEIGRLQAELEKSEAAGKIALAECLRFRAALAADETSAPVWKRMRNQVPANGAWIWWDYGKGPMLQRAQDFASEDDGYWIEATPPLRSPLEPAGKDWTIVTCDRHGRVHATWAGCSMCAAEKASVPTCGNPVMINSERYRGCRLLSGHEGECSAQNGDERQ